MLPITSHFRILRKKRNGKKIGKNVLISGGLGQTIKFWDTSDGSLQDKLRAHIVFVYDIQYVRDDRILTSSYDRKIRLWDVSSKKLIQNFKGHKGGVRNLCVLPTHTHFLSSSFDKTLRLWDIRNSSSVALFEGHKRYVRCVEYVRNLRMGISASEDRTMRLWDLEKAGKCIRTYRGHKGKIFDMAVDQRNNVILSGSSDRTIQMVSPNFREPFLTIDHGNDIYCLQFVKKKIVVGDIKGNVTLYDPRNSQEPLRSWESGDGEIWRIIPNKDDTQIITASKSIGFWNMKGKKKRPSIVTSEPTFALCHPNERKKKINQSFKQCMIDLEDRVRYLLKYLKHCKKKLNKMMNNNNNNNNKYNRWTRIENEDEEKSSEKDIMKEKRKSMKLLASNEKTDENFFSSSLITIKGLGDWGRESVEIWKSIIIYS